MSIAENVTKVFAELEQAAREAGRDPKEITLCAATKMNDADKVRQAIAAGIICCGENRVQELTEKLSQNAYEGAAIHFIGHLQTNKVKQVVGKVSLIQSVDSDRLLAAISKEAVRCAAAKYKGPQWVCGTASHLPVKDGSVGILRYNPLRVLAFEMTENLAS